MHRIGFDPPPIKEDKRLTGDLKEVSSYKKSENIEKPVSYPAIRSTLERLESLISKASLSTKNDQLLFEAAGNEMAELAIAEPGNYLTTLQDLKKLGLGFQISKADMISVQKGLLAALPPVSATPEKKSSELGTLNTIFIKELETYD